jgi:hypothetical protein
VRDLFYGLDASRMSQLLGVYGKRYGFKAEQYAIETLPKWRSGQVKVSGQTMTRLLDLLPRLITDDEKLELVRAVRSQVLQCLHRAYVTLEVADHQSMLVVVENALSLVRNVGAIELPSDFHEVAGWMTLSDAQAMSELVAETERYVATQRLADLVVQLTTVSRLRKIAQQGARVRVRTRFEIPTAQLDVSFKDSFWKEGPEDMATDDSETLLVRIQDLALTQEHKEGRLSFVEYVMRTLTTEEQERLRALAATEGVRLEVLLEELRVKTKAADGDIQATIATAEQLKRGRHKSRIVSDHATASGSTHIEIDNRSRPCYIATACYGDANHPDVRALRQWRDHTLVERWQGRVLIRLYHLLSPTLARRLSNRGLVGRLVRQHALEPLVRHLTRRRS